VNSIIRCQSAIAHPRITVKEKGRSLTIVNSSRSRYVLTQIDGCVITDGLRADYVLSKSNCGDLIIELKGVSVEHAYKQIMSTAEFWRNNGLACGRMAAVIICHQQPRMLTRKQHKQEQFRKLWQGPLHTISRNQEFPFEKLFEWKLYS
jgi:hypothetical protein